MKKTKVKSKNKKAESTKTIVISILLTALAIYLSLFLLFSFVALVVDLPHKYTYILSLLTFLSASFLTGFCSGMKIKQKGLITGFLSALPLNSMVILISLALSDFKADFSLLFTVAVLSVSSAAGGIAAVNKRYRR